MYIYWIENRNFYKDESMLMQVFKDYLSGRISISDEQFEQIISVSRVKRLRKKQYLLQEGEVWRFNAFILSGLVRVYSVDENGNEQILNFAKEDWWTGDRESLLSGNPSRFNIDAIEDSDVLLIEKDVFDKICKDIPAVGDMVHAIIQKSFIASQNRILMYKNYSAEQKYLDMITRYPDFAMRVPQHMIASYLGIKAETLSRVRNQAAKK